MPTCRFQAAYFSTANRRSCNNRTALEELRPLSGEICQGKQLQKGLFFTFKDNQRKPGSSFRERQATPVSIICGIQSCRERSVCCSMYAWRGGRNRHVRGHVSSPKQLRSWTEASSSKAGKPASETSNAVIYLPLRQESWRHTSMWGKGQNNQRRQTLFCFLHAKRFNCCRCSPARTKVNHLVKKWEPGTSWFAAWALTAELALLLLKLPPCTAGC